MTTLKPLWPGFAYKPHQEYAVNWLFKREQETLKGGLLCDEMGLGKTIQMLGLIKESPFKKSLLVLPLAVINQWKDTAIRCRINVLVFNKKWSLVSPPFPYCPSIYIIGYEALNNNIDSLSIVEFDRLVCDEAHRLGVKDIKKFFDKNKRINKLNYKTISKVKAKSKWFLTATPVVNSQDDVLSLFALMDIELLKQPLADLMHTYSLARSMEQLRSIMPEAPKPPVIQTHRLDFTTKEEEDFYISIQTNIQKQMAYNESALEILRLILLLRQLSIHPQVYIAARKKKFAGGLGQTDWVAPSTKFSKIKDLLQDESSQPHKWIIFCHFHEEMEMLKKYLGGLEFVRHIETYSGSQNIDQKQSALTKVREPFTDEKKCDVLLIQLKAGGVGLNLQEFDRIIFNSPWWTQAAIEQGIGRAVRIGQEKQVIVHNLVLKQEENAGVRNIDLWMKGKAVEKEIMNKMVLDCADRNLH